MPAANNNSHAGHTVVTVIPRLLTIEEAAEILKLHKDTVKKMCLAGKIASIRVTPTTARISAIALAQYIDDMTRPATQTKPPGPVLAIRAATAADAPKRPRGRPRKAAIAA